MILNYLFIYMDTSYISIAIYNFDTYGYKPKSSGLLLMKHLQTLVLKPEPFNKP